MKNTIFQITNEPEKMCADEIEAIYKRGQFKVVSADVYGTGVLHLSVSFNEKQSSDNAIYILRVGLSGQLHKLDTVGFLLICDRARRWH